MATTLLQLEVVLPEKVLLKLHGIRSVVIDTPSGSYGLLPGRLDCVSAVSPGILAYFMELGDEHFVAHDTGVMVKQGRLVSVSVRRAFSGSDLRQIHQQFVEQFLEQDQLELARHQLQTRLESGFLQRFAEFRHA